VIPALNTLITVGGTPVGKDELSGGGVDWEVGMDMAIVPTIGSVAGCTTKAERRVVMAWA